MEATVTPNGDVHIEGQRVGRIEGLGFIAELGDASDQAEKVVAIAASKALHGEIEARAQALSVAPDTTFSLADDGSVAWHGTPVARLVPGASRLKPQVDVLPNDLLDTAMTGLVQTRVQGWVETQIKTVLRPLVALSEADLPGLSRGIAYRLVEVGGTLRRGAFGGDLAHLTDDDRKAMGKLGVRFGVETVYLPDMLKPAAQRLLLVLTAIEQKADDTAGFVRMHSPLTPGQVSFPLADGVAAEWVEIQGYRVFGRRAARVDMLERFAAEVRRFLRDEALTTKIDSAPSAPHADSKDDEAGVSSSEPAVAAPVADAPAVPEESAAAPDEKPKVRTDESAEPEKPAAPQDAKILPPALMSLLGVGAEDTMGILRTLGYRVTDAQEGLAVQPKRHPKKPFSGRKPAVRTEGGEPPREEPRKHANHGDRRPHGPRPEPDAGNPRSAKARKAPHRVVEVDPDSPFAVLKNWGKTKP